MKKRQTLPLKLALLATAAAILPSVSIAANLSEIYQLAADKDSVIQASRAQYEAAIEEYPIRRAAMLPNIGVNATADANKLIDQDDSLSPDRYSATLTQSLVDVGAMLSIKKSKANVAQAEANLKEAQQALMFRTAQAYFNVLTASEAFKAASSSREAIAQQTEQAESRFDVGLSAITDVKEAQAQLDLAVAREVVAENQLALAKQALRVIIDQEVPELDVLKEDAELTPPSPASVEDWISVAEDNNPRYQSAQLDHALAKSDIGIERANRLPTIGLVGSYADSFSGDALGERSPQGEPQLIAQLNYDLFTGGATSAKIRQAKSRADQASWNLETVRRAVVQETRDAYLTVLADISQTNALKKALSSTEVAKDATQAGFDAGTRTAVEVLVSLRDTFNAYADYSAARHQYVISSLQLRQAAGILGEKHIDSISRSLTGF